MALISTLSFVIFGLAWLIPNHTYPWSSFWQELLAAAAFSLIALVCLLRASARTVKLPVSAWIALAAGLVPVLQYQFGLIYFAGDAWTAGLYLLGLGIALASPHLSHEPPLDLLAGLAGTILVAALISTGMALCQWLGVGGLGIYMMDMAPGGRPYGNLAQPNQLATLMTLGLVTAIGLFEYRRLGWQALAAVAAFLLFGVAMTQSRTALLEVAAVCLVLSLVKQRATLRLARRGVLAMVAWLATVSLLWPMLCDLLYLSSGRSLSQQTEGGARWNMWASLIDAVSRRPWTGYGWNQVAVAQIQVAPDHGAAPMTEYAHNVLLDVMVWGGLPLGLLFGIGLLAWYGRHLVRCQSPVQALLLAALGAVFVHAGLEYPLAYTYFLLPVGFMMGYADRMAGPVTGLRVPRWSAGLVMCLAIVLLARVTLEYAQLEASNRRLRHELAGYRDENPPVPAPNILLLSQLEQFPRFAHTLAQRGMSPETLDWMRQTAQRYGYPPLLLRYALAAGLNHRPQEAAFFLAALCKLHPPARCQEGLDAWQEMAKTRYPELQSIVLP